MNNIARSTSRSRLLRFVFLILVLLLVAIVIWKIWPAAKGRPDGMRPGAGGVTQVRTGVATQADVPVLLSALGTVTANATVTVTSRVDGQLVRVLFTEGQKVTEGQLLAEIDARSYQASLAQYQAELSQNQALLKSAKLTLSRYKTLYAQDSLSRQDLENQTATTAQYSGAVKASEAQVAAAKLNVSFTRITAPVSGRVGLRLVDVGNMVHSSDTTGIVTITQTEPVAVTFSVPQSHVAVLVKALHHGQNLPATAFDQDGKTELAQGRVAFISNAIDTSTGTIQLKALFDNHDEALYANQFVNLRLQTEILHQAVVIPSQALQLSSEGSFVFVVNQDHTVTRRAVKAGPAYGADGQAILDGVSNGERLVTEGIDRLTSGSKVTEVAAAAAKPAVGA